MLHPIRCFTCNAMVRFREYEAARAEGAQPADIFSRMEIKRYCCRRMLLCNPTELTDLISQHSATDIHFGESESLISVHIDSTRTVGCE